MSNYNVVATLRDKVYELSVTGPNGYSGRTQSVNITDMLFMARALILMDTGEPVENIGITLQFNLQKDNDA